MDEANLEKYQLYKLEVEFMNIMYYISYFYECLKCFT